MQAKTMVVDGIWTTVGSTNFDNRSFALNEELNLTVYSASVVRQLEEMFEQDLKYSKRITYEEWNSRGMASESTSSLLFRSRNIYDFARAPLVHNVESPLGRR